MYNKCHFFSYNLRDVSALQASLNMLKEGGGGV